MVQHVSGFPIGIPWREIPRNCAELRATALVLHGKVRKSAELCGIARNWAELGGNWA